MAIRKDVTINIFENNIVEVDEKIIVYYKDFGVDYYFTIIKNKNNKSSNLLENITTGTAFALLKKDGVAAVKITTLSITENKVKFTITSDLTDTIAEIGAYSLQLVVKDSTTAQIAIPPIPLDIRGTLDNTLM